jgi:hypothetical protein
MDFVYYLRSLPCKVFLKPDSKALKKIRKNPKNLIFEEKNKSCISGCFTKIKTTDETKISYYGDLNNFYFVNKMELPDYENTNDKQKYIYEISVDEIISIEMIFDKDAYDL